ncbi:MULTISPECIES: beta-carotene ketolase CrtW [Cyanophyceae]|uniref:beta-carotene ketolase CrtW n=1 Tax=Cyanophyceae TaxID=3028117 RepID=UPI0016840C88|nr:fatty acid desaturase [Trichocoleus sp. FACHB-40]MBD2002805.1 fatty acid desaturase [Trichocoleus sp. FACHB-40]
MLQLEHPPLQATQIKRIERSEDTYLGLAIAFAIITLWASSLIFLFSLDLSQVPVLWKIVALVWQTFLYTGLFITAHDAMHGVVVPQNLKINNFIGSLVLTLYGLFSFDELRKKHWEHHHHPASELDPDFHDSKHKNFFAWYLYFMMGYWSWKRLIGLMVVFNLISFTFHIAEANLTLFWVIPSILSSVQLFFFGTYLPHQEPEGGYTNNHRAKTNALPIFWSFITCYHFGYHEEHHEAPHVPWWKLPEVYKMNRKVA